MLSSYIQEAMKSLKWKQNLGSLNFKMGGTYKLVEIIMYFFYIDKVLDSYLRTEKFHDLKFISYSQYWIIWES